jgi:hypothetical protein
MTTAFACRRERCGKTARPGNLVIPALFMTFTRQENGPCRRGGCHLEALVLERIHGDGTNQRIVVDNQNGRG